MRAARLLTRAAVAATLISGTMFVLAGPVAAQAVYGGQDDTSVSAGASNGATTTVKPVGIRARGSVASCAAADGTVGRVGYQRVPADLLTDEQKAMVVDGGGIYWKTCGGQSQDKYSGTGNGGIFIPPRTRGGPPADPGDLAEQALDRTPLPEPTIGMAPGPEIPQLVNLPVFLWIPAAQWKPVTASASAGPVTSTVTAVPKRVVWDMGQGDKVTCDGPGLPYDPSLSDDANPSTCRYTFRRSSAGQPDQSFTVTATVQWDTTWTVTGASGGGGLGTVSRSSSTAIKVAELQALNVGVRR